MIDFHSHILPNIDDGSRNYEETINILKEANEAGFEKVISTSHYMEDCYEVSEQAREELINKIKLETNNLQLYTGSEIYITEDIVELIKNKKASTINNSKYLLFELPMNSKPLYVEDIVYRLIQNGYQPIIAHPERYSYVQDDFDYALDLLDMGVLFQSNYGSLIGLYGDKAKKTLKKMLKQDLVHFLGSDVHRAGQIYPEIPKILKKLGKIISKEKIEELTNSNAQKVLDNQDF